MSVGNSMNILGEEAGSGWLPRSSIAATGFPPGRAAGRKCYAATDNAR